MAVASTAILGAIGAAAALAGTAASMKQAHDQKKAAKKAQEAAANVPVYNAQAEKQKAANQEANANRKRVLAETDTIQTTALGNAGTTELKKKTLLGG